MSEKKGFLNWLHPMRTDHKQTESVEQFSVINHCCDAVGWRPVPYTIPADFAAFHANVENDVSAFISRAHPDMYNVHFYTETKEAAVKSGLNALEYQRNEHMRSIHNIRIYQDASKTELELYLKRLETDLRRKEGSDE